MIDVLFINEKQKENQIEKSNNMLDLWISLLDIKNYKIINASENTLNEIEEIKPSNIVLLGKDAMKCIFPNKSSVLNEAGNMYNFNNMNVFIMCNPSYFLHNPQIEWGKMLNNLSKELYNRPFDIEDNRLVLDLETTSKNPETGKIKRFGCYSYKLNKKIITSNLRQIQTIIDQHKIFIGFNIKEFDEPFLKNNGIILRGQILDLMEIAKKRQPIMREDFGGSYSLNNICKTLGLGQKNEIPLEVLMRDTNTPEEQKLIDDYLLQDIELHKQLYEWFDNKFTPFLDFVSDNAKLRYIHLTTSPASYTYKALCYLSGIEEKYADEGIIQNEDEKYEGGFVLEPTVSEAIGNVYCFDFASAYPHAFMMQNLYSKANRYHKCTKTHNNNGIIILKGTYCACEMGKLEKVLDRLQFLRKQYKKDKDDRQYACKIISNVAYGISGNPKFLSFYDLDTATDCTATVRGWIKFAIKAFTQSGYDVLYTDTDSVYLIDRIGDEKKLFETRDRIIQTIKAGVPFPKDSFDMGLECKIKAIFFFKDKDDKEKKKNYIYIKDNDMLVIKGLQIIKRNCTEVSKKIFETLKPQIIKNLCMKFNKTYLQGLIEKELLNDISLAAVTFKVGDIYKNTSSIQAQIYEKYGIGTHKLIRNKRFGVGSGIKLCTIEDAKKLSISDLDLDVVWSELSPFIKEVKIKKLGAWFK